MIGNIDILVKELCKLPKEVGWDEFKYKYGLILFAANLLKNEKLI